MDRHVELTVKNCSYCAESDKPYKCQTPPLTPVPLPERVWQKVAMDIMGPFHDGKHKFAIVLVDYYSKWCEVQFVNEVTTTRVKEFLIKVFASESYPEFLVTDNGVQFCSHEMKSFLSECNITHCRAALYHPQANGLVERMNRTVKEGIQIGKLEGKTPTESVRERLIAYHATPNGITGKTPFELMRGRKARTRVQIFPSENRVVDHADLKDKVKTAQAKNKVKFDNQPGVQAHKIGVGDFVKIKNPRHVLKGDMSYSKPKQVTNVQGNCVTLEDGRKWNASRLCKVEFIPDQQMLESEDDWYHIDIGYNDDIEQRDPNIRQQVQVPNEQAPRRGARIRRAPQRLNDFVT